MRILMFGAVLAGALSGAALTATAAAATPVDQGRAVALPLVQPNQGRLGVSLSHDETATLADGPVPALVSKVLPVSLMGAGLRPDSRIYRDERGGVHASLRDLLLESADHPDGNVIVYLDAPGTHGSRVLDIYEHWH
ncbi:hypothetical protein [Nocardia albiluteola]|nr:hypothetical protein [Nocardia albiluteola]